MYILLSSYLTSLSYVKCSTFSRILSVQSLGPTPFGSFQGSWQVDLQIYRIGALYTPCIWGFSSGHMVGNVWLCCHLLSIFHWLSNIFRVPASKNHMTCDVAGSTSSKEMPSWWRRDVLRCIRYKFGDVNSWGFFTWTHWNLGFFKSGICQVWISGIIGISFLPKGSELWCICPPEN